MPLVKSHMNRACTRASTVEFSFVPSPQTCNAFILCKDGQSSIGHCPPNFHFNVIAQECDVPANVDCTNCASFGVVQLPHPTDCRRYIDCMFGYREEKNCPANLLFDKSIGACNQAHMVKCDDGNEPTTTEAPKPTLPPTTTVPPSPQPPSTLPPTTPTQLPPTTSTQLPPRTSTQLPPTTPTQIPPTVQPPPQPHPLCLYSSCTSKRLHKVLFMLEWQSMGTPMSIKFTLE